MTDLIHSIAERLRGAASERRRALRRQSRRAAQLPFSVSVFDAKRSDAADALRLPSLAGHTLDLSESGLTLVVPSIRVGGSYLTDQECELRITLELPTGPLRLLAASVRFEHLTGGASAETSYLIGARITSMGEDDRARYLELLRALAPVERRSVYQREESRAF